MKIETRNKRIAELYLTTDYTLRKLGKIYNLCPSRIKEIIVKEIGIEKFKEIKKIRSIRVGERMMESYINNFTK